MIDSPSYEDEKNKKGVKLFVTRLLYRLPPSDLYTQQAQNSPHPIGANFQSACSRVMKIGGIHREENKSQKPYIYIYQERTGRVVEF